MDTEHQDREFDGQPELDQPFIPPPEQPSADELRSQAQLLRQVSTEAIRPPGESDLPLWAKLAVLLFFAALIAGVAYLLAFQPARRQLAVQTGDLWSRLYGTREDHLMRLPPPTRQATLTQVVQSSPLPAHFRTEDAAYDEADDEEPQGILHYNLSPEEALKRASEKGRRPATASSAPAEKTPAATAAFEFLKENSQAARKLAAGEVEGYRFKEWRPVRNSPPLYLISLAAADAQGLEVSLIWQVDMEKQQVRAMSQQARELAAQFE